MSHHLDMSSTPLPMFRTLLSFGFHQSQDFKSRHWKIIVGVPQPASRRLRPPITRLNHQAFPINSPSVDFRAEQSSSVQNRGLPRVAPLLWRHGPTPSTSYPAIFRAPGKRTSPACDAHPDADRTTGRSLSNRPAANLLAGLAGCSTGSTSSILTDQRRKTAHRGRARPTSLSFRRLSRASGMIRATSFQ